MWELLATACALDNDICIAERRDRACTSVEMPRAHHLFWRVSISPHCFLGHLTERIHQRKTYAGNKYFLLASNLSVVENYPLRAAEEATATSGAAVGKGTATCREPF
jgi:hypothetical protein